MPEGKLLEQQAPILSLSRHVMNPDSHNKLFAINANTDENYQLVEVLEGTPCKTARPESNASELF